MSKRSLYDSSEILISFPINNIYKVNYLNLTVPSIFMLGFVISKDKDFDKLLEKKGRSYYLEEESKKLGVHVWLYDGEQIVGVKVISIKEIVEAGLAEYLNKLLRKS